MPLLACLHMDVLSGERGVKAEKRKISESSGRLFLGTFFGGAKKVPRALVVEVNKIHQIFKARNLTTLNKFRYLFLVSKYIEVGFI